MIKSIRKGLVCPKLMACFKLKIEIENFPQKNNFTLLSAKCYSSALQKGGINKCCLMVKLINGVITKPRKY